MTNHPCSLKNYSKTVLEDQRVREPLRGRNSVQRVETRLPMSEVAFKSRRLSFPLVPIMVKDKKPVVLVFFKP